MFNPQSSLGVIQDTSSRHKRTTTMGYMAIGKVIKVHHKRNTADVQLLTSNDTISSSPELEGRHSCRIGVTNAGFDSRFGKPYGTIVPIQVGTLVLVAFLENLRGKPIILTSFHDTSEEVGKYNPKNILSGIYPITEDSEINRYTSINRIQDFITISGEGNLEVSSHTKSFVVGVNSKDIDEEVFDYENLSVKSQDKHTVSVGEVDSKPMKWLAVFRSHYADALTNWLRVFVNSVKSTFRVSRQDQENKKMTFVEITEDGSFKIRIQRGSHIESEAESYVEFEFLDSGELKVIKNSMGTTTSYRVLTEEE